MNKILKVLAKILNLMTLVFNKIIAHIHFIDPSENTKQRVMASLVLIPLAIYSIFYSKSVFLLLAISAAILMSFEWSDMIAKQQNRKKWLLIGFFLIMIPIYSAIKIRMASSEILFWMFSVIWATDIFAFFAGKTLGGPKLAPKISPNKTWSGLGGGIIASAMIGLMSSFMFPGGALFFVILSVILSIIEQLSDLLESKFKRIFGVKDSGNIIPGHGGILDRLDGLLLVAPLVLLLINILPSKFFS